MKKFVRRAKRSKMPSKAKVVNEKPKKAIKDIEKQISVLMKRTKLEKPETKYLDGVLSYQTTNGIDVPFQCAIQYPANGTAQGQRVGEKIQNLRVHLKGYLWGDNYCQRGQTVKFYILQSKLNTSSSYVDARDDFIQKDVDACHSIHALRLFERMKLWKVLATKTYHIPMPMSNDLNVAAASNWINGVKSIDWSFKIPSPEFDTGLLSTSINNGAVQILAVNDFGGVSVYPVSGNNITSGFRLTLQQRLTFTDA